VVDAVSGAPVTALIRFVRSFSDVVLVTIDIGRADFDCLHGADDRTVVTTLSVGGTEQSLVRSFRRLNNGSLFSR
jgi:hypothetical protein